MGMRKASLLELDDVGEGDHEAQHSTTEKVTEQLDAGDNLLPQPCNRTSSP